MGIPDSRERFWKPLNETKKGNTLMELKYLLFCLSVDLFDAKDVKFQKKSERCLEHLFKEN